MAIALLLAHGVCKELWVFVPALRISSFYHHRFVAQRFVKSEVEWGAVHQDSLHVIEGVRAHVVFYCCKHAGHLSAFSDVFASQPTHQFSGV